MFATTTLVRARPLPPPFHADNRFAALGHDKAQSIIDQITSAYESSGGPPPGGFGFGPQHLGGPPPGYGAPPMGFGGPMPPPGFGGRELTLLFSFRMTLITFVLQRGLHSHLVPGFLP